MATQTAFEPVLLQIVDDLQLSPADVVVARARTMLKDTVPTLLPDVDMSGALGRIVVSSSLLAASLVEQRPLKIIDVVSGAQVNMISLLQTIDVFLQSHPDLLANQSKLKALARISALMYAKYRSHMTELFQQTPREYKHLSKSDSTAMLSTFDRLFIIGWTLFAVSKSADSDNLLYCYTVLLGVMYTLFRTFHAYAVPNTFREFCALPVFDKSALDATALQVGEMSLPIVENYLTHALQRLEEPAVAGDASAVLEHDELFLKLEQMLKRDGRVDGKRLDETALLRVADTLIYVKAPQPPSPSRSPRKGKMQNGNGNGSHSQDDLASMSQTMSQSSTTPAEHVIAPPTPMSESLRELVYLRALATDFPIEEPPPELLNLVSSRLSSEQASRVSEALRLICDELPVRLRSSSLLPRFYAPQFDQPMPEAVKLSCALYWSIVQRTVAATNEPAVLLRAHVLQGFAVLVTSLVAHAERTGDGPDYSALETLRTLLDMWDISAFEFFPLVRPVFMHLPSPVPRAIEDHLRELEEVCLEQLAWTPNGPLMQLLQSPDQRSHLERVFLYGGEQQQQQQQQQQQDQQNGIKTAGSSSDSSAATESSPKPLSPILYDFIQRLFRTCTLRLKHLLPQLERESKFSPQQIAIVETQLATLVALVVIDYPLMLAGRHLDIILLSCIYAVWKVNQQPLTFKQAVDTYERVSRESRPERRAVDIGTVCRSVYLPEVSAGNDEAKNILMFYNRFFVPHCKDSILATVHPVITNSEDVSSNVPVGRAPFPIPSSLHQGQSGMIHTSPLRQDRRKLVEMTPGTKRLHCFDSLPQHSTPRFEQLRQHMTGQGPAKRMRLDMNQPQGFSMFHRRLSRTLGDESKPPSVLASLPPPVPK